MIETTTTTTATTNKQTNPKIICSAVHLSKKNCTKRSTMESENLDKKENHITSKTTEALKEQGTF